MKLQNWKLATALVVCSAALAATAAIDANLYLSDVKYLSSKDLKGRMTGSPELEKAARWIAARFTEFGLKPELQDFPATTPAEVGKGNKFKVSAFGHGMSIKAPDEFVPFHFSNNGEVSGGVVFAGYGITAPEYGYDDYDGIDVKDKVVVVLMHEPQEN